MTTRFSYVVLATIACLTSVAYADPTPATPAPATPADPRERLAGTYAYAGGEKEIAAKDAAIEKATESMFFATRGIARNKLRERTEVRKSIGFSFGNGAIHATAAGTAPAVSPENGSPVPYRANDGTTVTLSQRIVTDGRLSQTFTADGGTRTAVFALSADGKTITASCTILSSKIPQPIHYTLTYRRN